MKKTLKISEELHQLIKVYCVKNKLKMNDWVEKELLKIIKSEEKQKIDVAEWEEMHKNYK